MVDERSITEFITTSFDGVDVVVASGENGAPEIAWGDTFFIHHDDTHRFPFATIVTKDYGEFDNRSNLDRPGVFRLNVGVSKQTFDSLFADVRDHDYTALDRLIPHPVYAAQHWVSVLNPSDRTFASLEPLLAEAYEIAAKRAGRRRARADGRT